MKQMLTKLLGSGPNAVAGIDVGSSSIKVLQLARAGGSYRVEACAVEPLAEGLIADGAIQETEQVAEAIRTAHKRSGANGRECALAVSPAAVITKVINLPADLTEDDIEAQIEVEAGQYIPYPREEVSLDFEVLGSASRNEDLLEILLVASKTDQVDMRRDVAEMAGLEVKVMDVESFAVANAFDLVRQRLGLDAEETIGILDMGSSASTMIVAESNRVIYSRQHPFGGQQLIEECMRRYGMDAAQAAFLQRGDEPPAGFEDEVLQPFRQSVVQQIARALQFYSSSSDYSGIPTLYLTGGAAAIPGLAEAVGEEVDLSCEVADPIKGLALSPSIHVRAMERSRSALTTAFGLAMRGFD